MPTPWAHPQPSGWGRWHLSFPRQLHIRCRRTSTGLTIAGTGKLVLKGASPNTFVEPVTVGNGTTLGTILELGKAGALGANTSVTVNTGGTLLLDDVGTNDRINNTAAVILNGGKIAFSGDVIEGSSPGTGALTLMDDSVIDFAFGNSIINFANSTAAIWTGGKILSIYNWDGSTSGGGNDQIIFGTSNSTGLTPTQLGQVSFYTGGLGSSFLGNGQILANGEVVPNLVPVPEPSAVAVAMGLLGLVGWRERRNAAVSRRS